ncbi:BlaI/MecI/CopY family transcriptional regulator [candidate division KSB1 bacterium]|nr:BlaI/MecI/CopY family transcriptional regulator [candidate division KSB1 bacterium]
MSQSLPKIADSEWRVMKVLWKQSPLSAQQIIDTLEGETDWAPKTVKTLLNRLVGKCALGFHQEGRSYLYFPRISEEACQRLETRSFIDRVFDGALLPMVAAFCEDGKLTPEELKELREILEQNKGD